jgi:lantibiotic modifying enzyme
MDTWISHPDLKIIGFVAASREIGQRLVSTAVWHQDRCNWTGDEVDFIDGRWQVVHRSLDGSLYSGTIGIARFLAHLSRHVDDDSLRATALGALRHGSIDAERSFSPGLWTGTAGAACVLVEVGRLLNDPSIVERGFALGTAIAQSLSGHSAGGPVGGLDHISGIAGSVVALAHLTRQRSDRHLHEACDTMARQLIACARKRAFGWSWPMDDRHASDPHLCGLAHGASGMARAFAEAHAICGSADFAVAMMEAVRFEKSWFNSRLANWPDLRAQIEQTEYSYPVFWCHGAAGIGMARLRLYQLSHDTTVLAEATAAIEAAHRALRPMLGTGVVPPDWNLSVCHGLGSIVELLLSAYDVLGLGECLESARAAGRVGLQDAYRRRTWRCGVPGGGEHPGTMLGLAGIGLWCLRLADPAGVPPATMWE